MSQNELGRATSPYLTQHADNPVHWKVWNDEIFAEAQKQNKPILLSIGYAACHWCHVMAHESFEDFETATVMNDLFINVKVDREEHPDVDGIYQKALSVIGQQGGWPLTMFLTPKGEPFWGGTYFPKEAMYGRPSFKEVLFSISDIYKTKQDDVVSNVKAISDALDEESRPKGNGNLSIPRLIEISRYIYRNIDQRYGGLVGAPKFPQPVLFDFLWRISWINKDETLEKLVSHTLDQMCLGGIYDHLGGGFSRYSTDEEWLAPHFEKMLYDNALLISLMSMVWRKTQSDLYKRTITETIDWVLSEMKIDTPDGFVFASALDADSEGVEGKFYVWDEDEIDHLLGEESAVFKAAYDVSASGNWEEKNILRRITAFGDHVAEDALTASRQKLFQERSKRIAPGRDNKVLTDWNAMMIKALCEAGILFDRPDWIETAKTVYRTLNVELTKDNQLYHSWCLGELGTKAYLEDYANLALAALALYEVDGNPSYLDDAIQQVDILDQTFWDADLGGYNFAANQTVKALAVRPKPVHDNATPSGNGLMGHVLTQLYHLSGQNRFKDRFMEVMKTFASDDPNQVFATPGLCSALISFEKTEIFALISKDSDDNANSLKNKIYSHPSPHRKILLGDDVGNFGTDHPLSGKKRLNDRATVYVCRVGTCSAPLNEVDQLNEYLTDLT